MMILFAFTWVFILFTLTILCYLCWKLEKYDEWYRNRQKKEVALPEPPL